MTSRIASRIQRVFFHQQILHVARTLKGTTRNLSSTSGHPIQPSRRSPDGRINHKSLIRPAITPVRLSPASSENKVPRRFRATSSLAHQHHDECTYASTQHASNSNQVVSGSTAAGKPFDPVVTLWSNTSNDSMRNNEIGSQQQRGISHAFFAASTALGTAWLFGVGATLHALSAPALLASPTPFGCAFVGFGLCSTSLYVSSPNQNSVLLRSGLLLGSASCVGTAIGLTLPTSVALDALACCASSASGFALVGALFSATSRMVSVSTWQSMLSSLGAVTIATALFAQATLVDSSFLSGSFGAIVVLGANTIHQRLAMGEGRRKLESGVTDTIDLATSMLFAPFWPVLKLLW